MRATRADLLFTLPRPVERALLLGNLEEWAEALRAAGVQVVRSGPCDLVVAAASDLENAAQSGAPMLILDGHVGRRRLRRVDLVGERFLPMPSLDWPSLVLPLDRPRAARYALTTLLVPSQRIKRLRNRLLAMAIQLGIKPPGAVTIAAREAMPPLLVGAAEDMNVPQQLEWVLMLGRAAHRGVFHLFEVEKALPTWVLKFSRAQPGEIQAPNDATGLAAAAAFSEVIGTHAPRLIGVGEDAGRPFVVETAAIGAPLVDLLRTSLRRTEKMELIDAVAAWLVELGTASIAPNVDAQLPADLEVAEQLAPAFGVDFTRLAASLAGLPSILEHGHVGLEHVIVDKDSFVMIDWESAERRGLPLADLAFFLVQALPLLDGEIDDPRYGREAAFARLFRGDSPSAATLFGWLARACDAWKLDPDAVGSLLSVIWLRFAQIEVRRHFAAIWFTEPTLGPSWSAWRN